MENSPFGFLPRFESGFIKVASDVLEARSDFKILKKVELIAYGSETKPVLSGRNHRVMFAIPNGDVGFIEKMTLSALESIN